MDNSLGELQLPLRVGKLEKKMVVNDLLDKVTGVIHVGASEGQERFVYAEHDLNVLWFEPLPSAFEKLQQNLICFPKQRAHQYAVSNTDYAYLPFYVTDNEGQSSSIRELQMHLEVWPDVHHVDTIQVLSIKLDTFFTITGIFRERFQLLVLDAQGSELDILKGATDTLRYMKYAQIEMMDFEAYKGSALAVDIIAFMEQNGFREIGRELLFPAESALRSDNVFFERVAS